MSEKSRFVRVLAGAVLACVFFGAWPSQAAENKPPPAAARQNGKIVGIVTAKSDKDIMVKAEGESGAKRYLLAPQAGSAPSADVRAALKMVFPTDLVVLQWQGEQEPVVTAIQAIHSKTRFGMVAGTVVAVEAGGNMPCFDVKPRGQGYTERYVPQWDVKAKGWNKSVVNAIAGLNVDDKVKVGWSYDERKRAAQVQVLSRPKPKRVEKEETPDQTP